jgi:hypothetical protein
MTLINYIYYFYVLIIFHTRCIWTYQCHQCNTKHYNYRVTINSLPSPTEDDCNVVLTNYSCYVHVDWMADGTSEVYYRIDPTLPYDSIVAITERQVNLNTGKYSTRRSVGYSCRPNKTACNTIDDLKRVINSVTFPTDEQIRQLDTLIAPTKNFNSSSCLLVSSMGNCPEFNLTNCQRCLSAVLYYKHVDMCATCPAQKPIRNYFSYDTAFLLNTRSQIEIIKIGCQTPNACNSLKNMELIKRMLPPKLDLKKLRRSTASSTKSTVIFLFIIAATKLF